MKHLTDKLLVRKNWLYNFAIRFFKVINELNIEGKPFRDDHERYTPIKHTMQKIYHILEVHKNISEFPNDILSLLFRQMLTMFPSHFF